MRVHWIYGFYLLACSLALLAFLCIYHFTNAFDVVLYLVLPGWNSLPLSMHCNNGRLGNQMCTYATLFGLSTLNKRHFKVLTCNSYLRDIFVGPSRAKWISSHLYLKLNPWKVQPYMMPKDASIPLNSNFLNGYIYPCSYTFFDHSRDKLRQEFEFQDHFKHFSETVLRKANVHRLQNPTFVSVHVRRGDYEKRWLNMFDGVPVNMEYFQKAMQYFRERYKNVIFIAVSDDRLWCIQELSAKFGVYVAEEAPSPAHDLSLLASVNHSILTYGSFGFWGAYLAGGETIYFDKFLKPNTTFTREKFLFEKMYPTRWKGIVTVNSTIWFKISESTDRQNRNVKSMEPNSFLVT